MLIQRFKFLQIDMKSARNRLLYVLEQENMLLDSEVVETVMQVSGGDMRKVINLFQSIYLQFSIPHSNPNRIQTEGKIGEDCTIDDVYRITGKISPEVTDIIFHSLMNDSLIEGKERIKKSIESSDANVAALIPYLTEKVLKEVQGVENRSIKIDALNILEDVEKKSASDIEESMLLDYLICHFYILRNVHSK